MNKQEKITDVLSDVKTEVKRFLKKMEAAEQRFKDGPKNSWNGYSSKENAALKRSALDLKNELTRITQSTVY